MKTEMIDISEHNGNIDWKTVLKTKREFCVRVGYGSDIERQDDKKWGHNMTALENAKRSYYTYLYSYAKDVAHAKSEVSHYKRLIGGCNYASRIVFIDLEDPSQSLAQMQMVFKIFYNEMKAAGYKPGIYTFISKWNEGLKNVVPDDCIVWIADWRNPAGAPPASADAWQYTDKAQVAGVGVCDMSVILSDRMGKAMRTQIKTPDPNMEHKDAINEIAKQVIAGAYGTGSERKERIYNEVQNRVNEILRAK